MFNNCSFFMLLSLLAHNSAGMAELDNRQVARRAKAMDGLNQKSNQKMLSFICSFFACPKKEPKKRHPTKPPFGFVRSLGKKQLAINSLQCIPLRQNCSFF